jgi:hypothetical protein
MRDAVLLLTILLASPGVLGAAEPKPQPNEMVNNPPYANWSAFKPGTSVTQREVVTLADGTKFEQTITSKLVSRDKNKAVVETTMTEAGASSGSTGMAESTKTVTTYPAKVKMSQVDTPADASVAVTEGVEEVEVKGKKVDSEWVQAVTHDGDEVVTEKMWTARDVPGGLVRRTVTRKKGDTVVSDSTLELVRTK